MADAHALDAKSDRLVTLALRAGRYRRERDTASAALERLQAVCLGCPRCNDQTNEGSTD